jgi:hypothetical protein
VNKLAVVIVSSLLAGACAEESAPLRSAPPEAAETAVDPALVMLARGGDFRFSLDDSAVLPQLERKCAAAPAPASCLAEIRASASQEGVAIEPLGHGRIRYLSYGSEDGERAVYIDAELSVKPAGDGIVEMAVERIHLGKAPPPDARLLVEVVDDDTIAMDKQPGAHPRTGGTRLVFHRLPR